jgi:ADP-ribose pyrophosphatase
MPYQIESSTNAYSGSLIQVREDHVRAPSGHMHIYEIVEHPGAVTFVPLDQAGNVLLVQQYRHPAGGKLLEIPAGTLSPGEEPAECAYRECREEIGMAPGELIKLGAGYLAPGYSTEVLHFFLARELIPAPLDPDEDEELEIIKLPLKDLWKQVVEGKIQDIKTITGLALTRTWLEGSHP